MKGIKHQLGLAKAADLRARATQQAVQRRIPVVDDATPVAVRINHGRWVADCVCGGAVACEPGWPEAVCWLHDEDGARSTRVLTSLTWPAASTRARIVATLQQRARDVNRNWTPGETVADLERENAAHGVGG